MIKLNKEVMNQMTQKLKELCYLIAIIISTLCALSSVLFSLNPAITATVTFISVVTFAVLYFVVPTTDKRGRRIK
ncbi:hypothetical protein MUA26_10555 [Staphylococcus sp. IVB6246]|uniref:hypothetical protein n=3 Tax=Staphylococcus TaxID=1279 RepID=UPI0021CE2C49|nr:hypothetical protein [Staphylococcus sp. IVB6246]UXR69538.1 hypothetical protein MUA26_10555 [Staphylococcus sp. IVB6246]